MSVCIMDFQFIISVHLNSPPAREQSVSTVNSLVNLNSIKESFRATFWRSHDCLGIKGLREEGSDWHCRSQDLLRTRSYQRKDFLERRSSETLSRAVWFRVQEDGCESIHLRIKRSTDALLYVSHDFQGIYHDERLVIAFQFFRDPLILWLDDPTADPDPLNAYFVLSILLKLSSMLFHAWVSKLPSKETTKNHNIMR